MHKYQNNEAEWKALSRSMHRRQKGWDRAFVAGCLLIALATCSLMGFVYLAFEHDCRFPPQRSNAALDMYCGAHSAYQLRHNPVWLLPLTTYFAEAK